MLAVANSHKEITQILLNERADVNILDSSEGQSVLGMALEAGEIDVASMLLAAGATVDLGFFFFFFSRILKINSRFPYTLPRNFEKY